MRGTSLDFPATIGLPLDGSQAALLEQAVEFTQDPAPSPFASPVCLGPSANSATRMIENNSRSAGPQAALGRHGGRAEGACLVVNAKKAHDLLLSSRAGPSAFTLVTDDRRNQVQRGPTTQQRLRLTPDFMGS
jgi:hypothetical protein